MTLTDPRRYGDGSASELARLAEGGESDELQHAVSRLLAQENDALGNPVDRCIPNKRMRPTQLATSILTRTLHREKPC